MKFGALVSDCEKCAGEGHYKHQCDIEHCPPSTMRCEPCKGTGKIPTPTFKEFLDFMEAYLEF